MDNMFFKIVITFISLSQHFSKIVWKLWKIDTNIVIIFKCFPEMEGKAISTLIYVHYFCNTF